jgi:small-conductance mechanosensitive channel
VQFPVSFGQDVDLVKEVVSRIARAHGQVLAEPPPQVALEGILDSYFLFGLIVWVSEPVMTLRIASELRYAIAQAFAQRGIEFPTRTIELRRTPLEGGAGLAA